MLNFMIKSLCNSELMNLCRHRLTVRTHGSQPCNQGSIPCGGTKLSKTQSENRHYYNFSRSVKDFLNYGIFRIAIENKHLDVRVHNLRDWTSDNHRTVDDRPYGGGAGMILKIEPVYKAINEIKEKDGFVIMPTPRGQRLNQKIVKDLYKKDFDQMIFLCGHYEGFDERIHENLVDFEVSIGDYVLSGGELPTLVILDALVRNIPGVLGNENSILEESFEDGFLEYPQYSRPENFNGWKVPEVLLSGNHKEIEKLRKEKSIRETKKKRPDMLNN